MSGGKNDLNSGGGGEVGARWVTAVCAGWRHGDRFPRSDAEVATCFY